MAMSRAVLQESRLEGRRGRRGTRGEREVSPTPSRDKIGRSPMIQEIHNDDKGKDKSFDVVETFNIKIVSTTNRLDSSFSQFAVYNIDIRFGAKKWRVSRRFNQFVELHKQLTEEFPRGGLPRLPQKSVFKSSTNKQLVKERRDELNLYLQALSQKDEFAQNPRFIQWLSPDHNPTFIPTKSTTVHSGWLWKQGHVRKNWKWRWFVLKAQFLFYYKSKQAMQPKGAIPLQSCVTELSDLKEYCIRLQPDPKCETFFLRAESKEEIMIWFKKLRNASSVTKKGRPISTLHSNSPQSIPSPSPPSESQSPDFLRRPLTVKMPKFSGTPPSKTETNITLLKKEQDNLAKSAPKASSKLSVKYSPNLPSSPKSNSPKSPRSAPKSPPKASPKLSPKIGSMTPPAKPKITKSNSSFRLSPKKSRDGAGSSPLPRNRSGGQALGLGQPAIPEGKFTSAALNLLAASPYVDSIGKRSTGEQPLGSPRRPVSMAPTREREKESTPYLGLPPSVATWLNSVMKGDSSVKNSDSAMNELKSIKESVDKELSVISQKITEFLGGPTVVSDSNRSVLIRTQEIIVKISRLTIKGLLEGDTCEDTVKMLQSEASSLTEHKEFLGGVLFSFSRLSSLVSLHKRTSSAKSLHDMEEKANLGCKDSFPTESIQRRRTTMGHSTFDPPLPRDRASTRGARRRRQSLFPATRPVSPNILTSPSSIRDKEDFSQNLPALESESVRPPSPEDDESFFFGKKKQPWTQMLSSALTWLQNDQKEPEKEGEQTTEKDSEQTTEKDSEQTTEKDGQQTTEKAETKTTEEIEKKIDEEVDKEINKETENKTEREIGEGTEVKEVAEESEGEPQKETETTEKTPKSQPETVVCRICEKTLPTKTITEHAKICSQVWVFGDRQKYSAVQTLDCLSEFIAARKQDLAKKKGALSQSVGLDQAIEILDCLGEMVYSLQQEDKREKMDENLADLERRSRASSIRRTRRSTRFSSRDAGTMERSRQNIRNLKRWIVNNDNSENPDPSIGPFCSLLLRISSEQQQAVLKRTSRFWEEEGCDMEPTATIDDFEMVKPISSGAFGKVWLARKIKSGDLYAVKIIRKRDMIRKNMKEHVSNERNVMEMATNNPFLVDFYYAFQTDHHVYLVMEFIQGGDCGSMIENVGYLEEDMAKHYVAETVLALQYLHSMNIVHRDLKPDNMLMTIDGHIKLTDFGLSYIGAGVLQTPTALPPQGPAIPHRVVGTPDYIAPEALMGIGFGASVDWWSLGIVLFELLVGFPPFNDESPSQIFQNILKGEIGWPLPPDELSPEAKDLIEKLLHATPSRRLGANGAEEVKQHPFFDGLDWDTLLETKLMFQPEVDDEYDTGYFIAHGTLSMSMGGEEGGEEEEEDEDLRRPGVRLSQGNLENFSYVNFDGLREKTFNSKKVLDETKDTLLDEKK